MQGVEYLLLAYKMSFSSTDVLNAMNMRCDGNVSVSGLITMMMIIIIITVHSSLNSSLFSTQHMRATLTLFITAFAQSTP